MKVRDIIDIIDDIGTVRQVLFSANDEGTFITKDIVDTIEKIFGDYERDLLALDVIHK